MFKKINKFVFTKPEQVMQNIRRVSRYIEKKVVYEGGDASREVLHPINTKKMYFPAKKVHFSLHTDKF